MNDILLNIITEQGLDLNDIKSLCKSTKDYFYIYKYNKNYIYKRILKNYGIDESLKDSGNLLYTRNNITKNSDDYYKLKEYFYYYNLKTLNCSNKKLTSLPNLPNLVELDCRNNNLISIPYFPRLTYFLC